MTGDETKSCFCLDETEASKAELNRLADELSEIYPLYLKHKSTGSACQDIPQLKTAASALIKEFTKLQHALDEYGDGELAKTARRMSYALARFDYLNGANYEALVSAVKSFAGMLPSTGGINAKEAARLMNRIKMGYFPTDPDHVRLIKSAVKFPDRRVNLLDPCCGEGLALKEFSDGENACAPRGKTLTVRYPAAFLPRAFLTADFTRFFLILRICPAPVLTAAAVWSGLF